MKDWLKSKEDFEVKDVRKLKDNFLPAIIEKAKKLDVGQGLCIIQDFQKFDELFAMFAWNQGIGYFSSEIGPSALFAAYKYVKTEEEKNTDRHEIIKGLMEKFGEKNPNVSTF